MTLDILKIPDAWIKAEGFAQPDWKLVGRFIRQHNPEEGLAQAWDEASRQWLETLRHTLGADCHTVYESTNFLLLTAKSSRVARHLLQVAEQALSRIRSHLGNLAWRWKHGKHVILIFEELDAYYRYISHFYPDEGEFPFSSGVFLNRGYCHTALPPQYEHASSIIHELCHLCVAHLPIPRWLNEGLALNTEAKVTGAAFDHLDNETLMQHRSYWNSDTIQGFWVGSSFHQAGEECKLSYSLAEVLVGNMQIDHPKTFHSFAKATAKCEDAGESAAWEHLKVSLGAVASTFLGEGDWAPKKTIS